MADEAIKLLELGPDEIPADLKAETYFDFEAHPFEHRPLLDESYSVVHAIGQRLKALLGGTCSKERGPSSPQMWHVPMCFRFAISAYVMRGSPLGESASRSK